MAHNFTDNRSEIIAEAGVNHNGDIELAKELVDVAVEAGADTVKFQTFQTEEIVTESTERTEYQKRSGESSQYEMLQSLELSQADHEKLVAYCDRRGIEFLSTPYDPDSVELLEALGVKRYKIASADIINKPLLEAVAETGKPVILSTGMARLGEIEAAVEFLRQEDCGRLVLLHCVSCYPTDPADVNLGYMETLKQAFDVPVGFSDHTLGTAIPIGAVGMGASLVEKHYTLDRSMDGPDHDASLEPDELEEMITKIRDVEAAVGDGSTGRVDCEEQNRQRMRRSLYAQDELYEGEKIKRSDLRIVRPAEGISPWEIETVVGRTLGCDLEANQPLQWHHLQ
jgi:N-acetylneuraminate synthase